MLDDIGQHPVQAQHKKKGKNVRSRSKERNQSQSSVQCQCDAAVAQRDQMRQRSWGPPTPRQEVQPGPPEAGNLTETWKWMSEP